jgi:hypothetical protein
VSDSTLLLRRCILTVVMISLATIGAVACSNQGSSVVSVDPSRPNVVAASPYTYYNPIDYPNKSPNRITGIADNKEIVGVYGDGSTTLYSSYTLNYHTPSPSQSPYPTFVNLNYPDAPNGTYLTSIVQPSSNSKDTVKAGYVINPDGHNGNLPGEWGVVDNEGLWTLIQNHPGAGMMCHNTELFGIDAKYNAVGFSWLSHNGSCTDKTSTYSQVATEVQAGGNFNDYKQAPGTFSVATGIYETGSPSNLTSWVVGSTNNSGSGTSEGWISPSKGNFTPWQYPGAISTQFNGVNSAGEVVGTYKDSNSKWHGFTVTGLFTGSSHPSSPIDLGDKKNTVVSGVDSSGDICGWYEASDGLDHGFVGIHN